jgi:DNA-binding NtrC family response regulator
MTNSPTAGYFRALVIDDEQSVRAFVAEVLSADGWNVSQSPSMEDALEQFHKAPAVVFCDDKLAGANGYNVIRAFKENLPDTKVVLVSNHGGGVLDARAFGAYDYLVKPFRTELQLLSQMLREQLDRAQKTSSARHTAAYYSDLELAGRSHAFLEVMKHVVRVSETNLPVLLTGESGTGKELVAVEIHQRSARAERPFIVVKCATTSEAMDLNPWEKAGGGTVFFEEITKMSSSLQAKLVEQLQSDDLRVIAATDRDLEREVAAGRFRTDLFYRLNPVSIALPPLRERREDIPPLAQSFADRVHFLRPAVTFSPEALELLVRYNWPGNIRELETTVVRAVGLSDGTVRVKDLPQRLRQLSSRSSEAGANGVADHSEVEDWVPLSEIEGRYVAKVLEHTRGNKQAAARVLGVDRKTLDRMIKRHHIETRSLRARTSTAAANSTPSN